MSCRIAPTYHVLNMDARWSVDVHLNDEELKRCFPLEYVDTNDDTALRMYEFHNHPHSLEFNRSVIVDDVRRALYASPDFSEQFVHANPFAFMHLAFIRYGVLAESGIIESVRFSHRVLA